VSLADIDRAVRLSVAGLPVGKFNATNGEQYNIVVRTPIAARADLHAFNQVRVATRTSSAAFEPTGAFGVCEHAHAIHRYNRDRAVVIDAQVKNGFNTARLTDACATLDKIRWPRVLVRAGATESRNEVGGLGAAMIVAILGIVAI